MVSNAPLPRNREEALEQGFQRMEALPNTVRQVIESIKNSADRAAPAQTWPCTSGHTGPCSVTYLPEGITEICYCNAANQCDDCYFRHP